MNYCEYVLIMSVQSIKMWVFSYLYELERNIKYTCNENKNVLFCFIYLKNYLQYTDRILL